MMINYRQMKPQDTLGVFRVDQNCFEHNWTLESYENEVNNILSNYIVAEINGEIIGFGGFWLIIDEAHITNIGVLEKYRCCGIGQNILNEMISDASNKGCIGMTLEVRSNNQPAINFYIKNEFIKEGIRKNYYGNGLDGIIMWRYGLG